tara:strand:+ start:52 stop:903 length:852 start_codon:yes stop_codon:yes gene_type:complete
MNSRNRSEGWKHAKITGHTNESDITSKINKNKLYRENLEKKLNLDSDIKSANEGGLKEKNVQDVFGGSTKSKTDLKITFINSKKINLSIKKSLGGQVYLIGVDRFINGFEIQFKCKVPQNIKRSFKLFFAGADDTLKIIENTEVDNIKDKKKEKIKKYEMRKNRITWITFKKYDLKLSNTFIEWFKDNISNIFLFCFERGLSKNKSEWADYVWYKNELEENNVDAIFNISKLSKIIDNKKFKSMIVPGKSLGGTTIQLPFGSVQWHLGQIQFRHDLNLMRKIL